MPTELPVGCMFLSVGAASANHRPRPLGGAGQLHIRGNGVRHAGMAWSDPAGTLGAMQFAEGDTAAEPPRAVLQGHSEKIFLHASAQLVSPYVRLPWPR